MLARLTQTDLAAACGTRQSYIARVECGKSGCSYEFLMKIADAIGVPVGALSYVAEPKSRRMAS